MAIAAPTPTSSLVHSSTLVTAGLFLIFINIAGLSKRFIIINIILIISSVLIVVAAVNAIVEIDVKKIIAFSTLSQLSIIFVILGLNYSFLFINHLLNHAIFKSLLFIGSGCLIYYNQNNQNTIVNNLGLNNSYITRAIIFIRCLILTRLPFTSSFYSKHFLFSSSLVSTPNFIYFRLILARILTIIYCFKLIKINYIILSHYPKPTFKLLITEHNILGWFV